jgi:myosin-7
LSIEGRDDAVELKSLREALKILSFSPEEVWQIFSVLAALLHLGNLKYKSESLFTAFKQNLLHVFSYH